MAMFMLAAGVGFLIIMSAAGIGCCTQNTSAEDRAQQKLQSEMQALLSFAKTAEDPTLRSWSTNTSPCEGWYGITCGDRGQVIGISLNGLDLNTTLPTAWSSLDNLSSLSMSKGMLRGPIPRSWSHLRSLEELYLNNNSLTGTISSWISSLSALKTLQLSHNDIYGVLPDEWPKGMHEIRLLAINGNRIQGMLPKAWGAHVKTGGGWYNKLEQIQLAANRITGDLPRAWSTFHALHTLELQHNCMSQSIPVEWADMPLNVLKLDGNPGLTGTLPSGWARSPLTEIWLLDTGVFGPLPESWSVMTSMRAIHLSKTRISGTLPWAWSTLSLLKELTINDNALLSGRLPETWSNMKELQVVDFHACNLTGPLPHSWGKMSVLRHLNGSFNKFSGTIPDSWSSLAALSELALNNNRLIGTIPDSLTTVANLSNVCLSGNMMRCHLQECDNIGKQSVACNAIIHAVQASKPYIFIALSSLVLMVAFPTLGLVLAAIHARSCKDRACMHRHPGFIHPWLGALTGIVISKRGCKWCSWDQKTPDLKVRAHEMEISLEDGIAVGSGAFGVVHQAWWRGHEVAVKILHNMNNDDSLVTFAKELEFGMKLQDCASFARVLGACLERPYVCIISEFLQGGSLRNRIHKTNREQMTIEEVLNVSIDLAEGLNFIHPEIVHRDLKPDNIMLTRDGRARIIDFGIGRMNASPLLSCATDGTDVAGTSAYMAPEALAGKVIDKGDVYALGVIINECLTCEEPFKEYRSPYQIQYAICVRDERPCLATNCPSLLAQLILKCWNKDWQKRPTSRELLIMLRRLLEIEKGTNPAKALAINMQAAELPRDLGSIIEVPDETLEDNFSRVV